MACVVLAIDGLELISRSHGRRSSVSMKSAPYSSYAFCKGTRGYVEHRHSRNFITANAECSSSVVECRTRNRESPGSNPPLLPFRRLGIFRSLHRRPCSLSCINEYLAIDSGGNVSDLVLARNCCLARMLPGEAENGVGMNRSVREGKKCKAL